MRDDASWFNFYNELVEYKKENDHVNVPAKYVTKTGIKLGSWLKKQKELYMKGRLLEERINMLEDLGIVWSIFEEQWNKNYEVLLKYNSLFGNIDVPQEYITPDGVPLGRWLQEQRNAYKNRVLNKRRTKLLKELNIKWNPRVDTWDAYYYKLEEFYEKNGHIDIPSTYITADNFKLGRWLTVQRSAYNGTSSCNLNQDQRMLLNDLGIDWSARDTKVLNATIEDNEKYREIMLGRLDHILEDMSFEMDTDITDKAKEKTLEMEIVRRMWK